MGDTVQEQIATRWQEIATQLPESTPDQITEALRLAYLGMIEEDPRDVLVIRQTGKRVTSKLRPGVAQAFARQAAYIAAVTRQRARQMRRLAVYVEDMPRMLSS